MQTILAGYFNTLNAEAHRRSGDSLQQIADDLHHWNPFPKTLDQKQTVAVKREQWATAEEQVRGARRKQNAAAHRAGTALLRANRESRRRGERND